MAAEQGPGKEAESAAVLRMAPADGVDKRSYRRDVSRIFWFALSNTPLGTMLLPSQLRRALSETEAGRFALSYPLARWGFGEALVTEVDPHRLETWLLSFAMRDGDPVALRDFFVGSGDWSSLLRDVATSPLHHEIVELLAHDLKIEDCPVYHRMVARLSAEGPFVRNYIRLSRPEDVQAYLQHYVDLIESVRARGLLRKAERANAGDRGTVGGLRSRYHQLIETDVGVAVDRDGRLHRFRGGFHRTAIAKGLGLDRMPVAVKLVHAEWLKGVMADTGLPPHQAVIAGIEAL